MQNLVVVRHDSSLSSTLDGGLASIPEESVWLAAQKSKQTRRAYKGDVIEFITHFGLQNPEQLRAIDHRQVIAWEAHLRESEGHEHSTVRRKLSALSSLFGHLKNHGLVDDNPVRDVKRPAVNRLEGTTPAFSQAEARLILDSPPPDTLAGKRDRAILAVGFYAGPRANEICKLKVEDFYRDRGLASLRFRRKGGKKGGVAIHPACENRIQAYLDAAAHGDDPKAPLFLPLRGNRHAQGHRHLDSSTINRILERAMITVRIDPRDYSPHSMRATFITTALKNGATLEEAQHAAGHANPQVTKMYDRRAYDPEKSASFKADY